MDPAASSRPSGPWALFWLGGASAAVWIPLLLADAFPVASTATTAPSPLVASLAQAPAPLHARPRPWLNSARRAASPSAPVLPRRIGTAKAKAKALATPKFALTQAPATATASVPARQPPLPGSLLLGGALTLASLHEKPMVPAARIEQAQRARSTDRLSAVPDHWRPTMEALIQGKTQVLPAEVVHLPAPHLQTAEEYPMAVQSDGVAESPVTPSAPSLQALKRWAERQSPTPQGSVRPVMVVLEPLAAEPGAHQKTQLN